MDMDSIQQALYQLGKELTCSICLSIMHKPCARLPCCHYFCRECVQHALRAKPACPICKNAAHRRDVFADEKLDRIITLYGHMEAALGQQLLCSQLPGPAEAAAALQKAKQQHQKQANQQPKAGKKQIRNKQATPEPEQQAEGLVPAAEDEQQQAKEQLEQQQQQEEEHQLGPNQQTAQQPAASDALQGAADRGMPSPNRGDAALSADRSQGICGGDYSSARKPAAPDGAADNDSTMQLQDQQQLEHLQCLHNDMQQPDPAAPAEHKQPSSQQLQQQVGRDSKKSQPEHSAASSVPSWIKAHAGPAVPGLSEDAAGEIEGDQADSGAAAAAVAGASGRGASRSGGGHRGAKGRHTAAAAADAGDASKQPQQQPMRPPPNRPAGGRATRSRKVAAAAAAGDTPVAAEKPPAAAAAAAAVSRMSDSHEEGGPKYRAWLRNVNLQDLKEDLQPLSSSSTGLHSHPTASVQTGAPGQQAAGAATAQQRQHDTGEHGAVGDQEVQQGDATAAATAAAAGAAKSSKKRKADGAAAAAAQGTGNKRVGRGKAAAAAVDVRQRSIFSFMGPTQEDTAGCSQAGATASRQEQLQQEHHSHDDADAADSSQAASDAAADGLLQQQDEQQVQQQGLHQQEEDGGVDKLQDQQALQPAEEAEVQQQQQPENVEAVEQTDAAAGSPSPEQAAAAPAAVQEQTAVPIAAETAAQAAAGPAAEKPSLSKRAAAALKALASSDGWVAATPVTTSAAAAAANNAAAAASGDQQPGATAAASGGGRSGGSRRIPARLLPWNCSACTFENQGSATKCVVCNTAKGRAQLTDKQLAAQAAELEAAAVAAADEQRAEAAAPTPTGGKGAKSTAAAAASGGGAVRSRGASSSKAKAAASSNGKPPLCSSPAVTPAAPVAAVAAAGTPWGTGVNSAGGAAAAAGSNSGKPAGGNPAAAASSGKKGTATRKRPSPTVAEPADDNSQGAATGSAYADDAAGVSSGADKAKKHRRCSKQVRLCFSPATAGAVGGVDSVASAAADGDSGERPPAALVTPKAAAAGPPGCEFAVAVDPVALATGSGTKTAAAQTPGSSSRGTSPAALGAGGVVLTGSGLTDAEKASLKQLALAVGGRVVDSWSPSITHVVCHTNENREARRTLKYMQGILHGCWVISSSWVTACLAATADSTAAAGDSKGAAANATLPAEAPHEVLGDSSGGVGGPARGRERKDAVQPPLMAGREVFVAGAGAAKESCMTLVKAAGGSILHRLPPATAADDSVAAKQKPLVIAPDSSAASSSNKGQHGTGAAAADVGGMGGKAQVQHAVAMGLPVVGQRWLVDSISSMQLLPTEGFEVKV